MRSWRKHWDELATMFKYPEQIRRIIYATNAIENFNRQLRKVTKTKSAFVSDDTLLRLLYLITMQVTDKWTMPIKEWGSILMHLRIYFGDRSPSGFECLLIRGLPPQLSIIWLSENTQLFSALPH
ncbi:transposase [Propionispora hippei]